MVAPGLQQKEDHTASASSDQCLWPTRLAAHPRPMPILTWGLGWPTHPVLPDPNPLPAGDTGVGPIPASFSLGLGSLVFSVCLFPLKPHLEAPGPGGAGQER